MGIEANKDLVRRFYAEVINGRDAATGERLSFPSTAVIRCAGGEIAEATDVVGVAELMARLGADG